MSTYSFKYIEKKWQDNWSKQGTFNTNYSEDKPKYYVLEMFPYPSGKMHVGHVRNYSIGDVIARYKKSKGFNIMHPMGWDSFGLPAENAAKDSGVSPKGWTYSNIEDMKKVFKSIGFSIDWGLEVVTCSEDYYKYEQKMFIEFYKHNLAYKKESWVNWDPVENTVLANEQVVNGKGWRSGADVEQKQLSQWFLKITDFADDLLSDLSLLEDWPEKVKNMQANWIGKSSGAIVSFELDGYSLPSDLQSSKEFFNNNAINVYTTRPDTLFAGSFVALSIRHPLVSLLSESNPQLKSFVAKIQSLGTSEENIAKEEKLGFDTELKVINPFTKKSIPLFLANYVLDYATLSVFGCPAHDKRDFEFAKKYNLEIKTVISPSKDDTSFEVTDTAYEDEGYLINSDILNGLYYKDAKQKAIEILESKKQGISKTTFKLKDWGVSRQRYWGCPIPIVYCDNCGTVAEKEENLPIILPDDVNMNTSGNPLAEHPTWKHTVCPLCAKPAIRETDTLDTFFESSWYFLRYATVKDADVFDSKSINYWLPVDQYIGGVEHAVMHLLYSRFFVKALKKVGLLKVDFCEPFKALMTQGMICHKSYKSQEGKWLSPDEIVYEDGGCYWLNPATSTKEKVVVGRSEKMSKSKKNTVDPINICSVYGADTVRMFVLSDSPVEKDLEWTDEGVEGVYKFINRLWKIVSLFIEKSNGSKFYNTKDFSKSEQDIYSKVQKFLHEIEAQINDLHLNKAIALGRELTNLLDENKNDINNNLAFYSAKVLLSVFNPFVPHVCEQLWEKFSFNTYLADESWLSCDKEYLILDTIQLPVQIMGKTKGFISINKSLSQEVVVELIENHESLSKFINGKTIKKIIYVQGRIINFVV